MGRANYGRVGGRRGGSAVWQWVVIGITLGLGCSVVFVLGMLTLGVLNLDTGGSAVAADPTDPPSPPPTADVEGTVESIVAATMAAQPSPTTIQVEVAPPTATDIPPPTEEPDEDDNDVETGLTAPDAIPDDDEEDEPDGIGVAQAVETGLTAQDDIPAELLDIASELLTVQGGTFEMGTTAQEITAAVRECVERDGGACEVSMGEDSTPPHPVTLDTFQIEVNEVTNEQYIRFLNWMGPNSHQNGCFNQRCIDTTATNEFSQIVFDSQNYDVGASMFNRFPIAGVTWYGARAYCEAIGRRLPTEAEWERAARGLSNNIYPWGNEWNVDLARTSRAPDGSRQVGAVEVGSLAGNASEFGAVDMAGNVAEWVSDWYSPSWYRQAEASGLNPTGPPSGTQKVVRGGSWDAVPFFARSVNRQFRNPGDTYLWVGFRCAADFEEESEFQLEGLGELGNDLGGDLDIDLDDIVEDEEVDAAPTLPPRPTPQLPPTQAPAVPPGG
jgi:formylglycine-generating enzyme required for sulfatase activity